MVNFRVEDLDALLANLASAKVRIDPKQEDYPYGRSAWIWDPEGNRIELWQPTASLKTVLHPSKADPDLRFGSIRSASSYLRLLFA